MARATRPAAYKLTDSQRRGQGRLVCRIAPSGSKDSFFRYRVQGRGRLIKIGRYDPDGKPGALTLADAIRRARELGEQLQQTPDLKESIELTRRHEQRERRNALLRENEAAQRSLRALLSVYVAFLRREGKPSVRDAGGGVVG